MQCNSGVSWGLYFAAYNNAKQRWQGFGGANQLTPVQHLLAAAEGGAVVSTNIGFLKGWLMTFVCNPDIMHSYPSLHIKCIVSESPAVVQTWLDCLCAKPMQMTHRFASSPIPFGLSRQGCSCNGVTSRLCEEWPPEWGMRQMFLLATRALLMVSGG